MFHRDKLVTAGHNVYDKQLKWVKEMKVYLGRNGGNATYGVVNAIRYGTTTGWMNSSDRNMDYALVELDSHIGVLTGWFGYGYNQTSVQTNVTIAGYPKNVASHGSQEIFTQWAMSGNIVLQNDNILYYMIDATGGQSGAPIYKSDNMAVGVHVAEFGNQIMNMGKRIHKDMYDWMQRF